MESLGTYHEAHIFKYGECGQKFNEYDLMKAYTHSCGHVNKTCTKRGCNKTFLTKGGLTQHIKAL